MLRGRTSALIVGAFAFGAVAGYVAANLTRASEHALASDEHRPVATKTSEPSIRVGGRNLLPRVSGDWASVLAFAAKDPADALIRIQRSGASAADKSAWLTHLMARWTLRDPEAAWAWLRAHESALDDFADGTLPAIALHTMAEHRPALALQIATAALTENKVSGPFAAEVIATTTLEALTAAGEVNPARAALEVWIKDPSLPHPGASAYTSVASALGRGSPNAAANWLTSLPPSVERNTAIADYATTWTESDSSAALAWVRQLPEADRNAALERTIDDLLDRNPSAASSWLGTLLASSDAPPDTDRLIEAYVNRAPVLRNRPDLARQWLALIADPATRAAAEQHLDTRSVVADAD